MLATGGTLAAAIQFLVDRGADHITAICLLSAPEGCARLEQELEGLDVPVTVVTAGDGRAAQREGLHRARASATPATGSTASPADRAGQKSKIGTTPVATSSISPTTQDAQDRRSPSSWTARPRDSGAS